MKRFKFLINEVQVSVIIDTVILNRINITHNSDVNLDDILTKISEETGIENYGKFGIFVNNKCI